MRLEWIAIGMLVLGLAAGAARAEGEPADAAEGRATLPLDELLRLRRELDERVREPEKAPPPLAATLDAVELQGRLVEQSLELSAQLQVTVLEEGWVSVPLLRLTPTLKVLARPDLAGANLAVKDGWLALLTREPGRYRFELALLERAPSAAGPRRIELETAQATLASLHVQFDERLYRVEGPVTHEADGVRVDPEGTRFRLAWEPRGPIAERVAEEAPRPELEPVIPAANASLVSTLEGRWLTRVLYRLRFTGTRELELKIPAGVQLTKVFRDRVALPFALEEDRLRLSLSPARSGGEEALLELVLEQEHGAYHLAGRLDVELPAASWPIHEIALDLHLPPVFDYTWLDGSLSPASPGPEPDWSYELPEPGERLSFHELLVTRSAPRLTLGYDVDLTDAYFVP